MPSSKSSAALTTAAPSAPGTRQVPGPRAPTSDGAVTIQPGAAPRRRRFRLPSRQVRQPGRNGLGGSPFAHPGRVTTVAALAVVVGAVVLAGRVSATQADQVEASLAAATASARRVSAVAAPIRPESVRTDLLATGTLDQAVQDGRGGLAWTVSRWTTNSSRLGRLDREADGLTRLAGAGRPLGAALVAATSGNPDRTRLEALASSTAGYAAAARASGIVMDDGMRPLAAVAARLPDLAAGPGPRRWTVCTTATGPCELLKVTEGTISSRRTLRGGPPALRIDDPADPTAVPGDLVVIGKGSADLVSGTHLSVRALIDVLLRTAPGTAAQNRTSVRTVVALSAA